jgi:hypothetical protein
MEVVFYITLIDKDLEDGDEPSPKGAGTSLL